MSRNTLFVMFSVIVIAYLGNRLFSEPEPEELQPMTEQEAFKETIKPSKTDVDPSRKQKRVVESHTMAASTEALDIPAKEDESYAFKSIDAYRLNKDGIDKKFVRGGVAFQADFSVFKQLREGQEIKLDLAPIYVEYSGVVTKSFASDNGTYTVQIKFPNDSEGSYVSLHYSSDGRIEGKLYSLQGNYEITHNGKLGYLISFEEMERQEKIELEEAR